MVTFNNENIHNFLDDPSRNHVLSLRNDSLRMGTHLLNIKPLTQQTRVIMMTSASLP
jgi:hypothetical protein